jgi:DNA-binding NarL/FixJ family response regulator
VTALEHMAQAVLGKPQPHEVLTVLLLAQDVDRAEIARRQRIHRSSVDNRVSKLLRRYKLGTAAALVALFLKNGWIRLEDV